jgi:hypothetical protein
LRPAIFALAVFVGAAGCGTPQAGSPSAALASAGAAPSAAGPSSSGQPAGVLWPAPSDPMERTVAAGLKPGPKEYTNNHVHAHLDVFVDGKPVTVPSGIGIKVDDPAVQRDELPDGSVRYGGIELCNEPCISPLHTHDTTGVLHTESSESQSHTLGEFFTEWGVVLNASCVATFCSPTTMIAVYVDGELATGDPREIVLTDQREIAVVIGTPPPVIPRTADFSNA